MHTDLLSKMRIFMNTFFRKIKSDKTIFFGIITSLILILFSVFYIAFTYSSLPPFIPLFNQMPWGESRIGTKIEIFIPFAITLFVFIINTFISSLLYEKTPLISRMLSMTGLLVCLFTLLFVIRTVRLIT